jgi:hypothetical protein
MDPALEAAARRLRRALDMFRTGEAMMRQQLRRKHPEMSPEEIERRVVQWLEDRPGAPFGDGPGTPVPWPRQPR